MQHEEIDLTPSITRKMVWDIVPCPFQTQMIERMGLIPGSPGGVEQEHAASHRRLNRILPIAEAVELLSVVAGEVAGRTILDHHGIDLETDLDNPHLQQFIWASVGTTVAVVANLVDYGILRLSDGTVGERE